LEQVQPLSCRQNSGCQPSIVILNVVHGSLLEPPSEDVQPDQRSGTKLHLGGKASNTWAKVKWDSLTLPLSSGGLGIIDPKAQSKALLAKLLVRGLAPGGKPWKEILKHQVDQVHLPVHGKGPSISDINWFFAAPKLKQTKCSFWKIILGYWLNIRVDLTKSEPASHAEVLKQPIFNNPLILNTTGLTLGVCGLSEGRAIANFGCTIIKYLWDLEGKAWKSLQALWMTYHTTNRNHHSEYPMEFRNLH